MSNAKRRAIRSGARKCFEAAFRSALTSDGDGYPHIIQAYSIALERAGVRVARRSAGAKRAAQARSAFAAVERASWQEAKRLAKAASRGSVGTASRLVPVYRSSMGRR